MSNKIEGFSRLVAEQLSVNQFGFGHKSTIEGFNRTLNETANGFKENALPLELLCQLHKILTLPEGIKIPRTLRDTANLWKKESPYVESFKISGVNPTLPVPLVIHARNVNEDLLEKIKSHSLKQMPAESHNVIAKEDFEAVPFNVKNIIKLYKYPLKDAKMFYQAFRQFSTKLAIAVPIKRNELPVRTLCSFNLVEEPTAVWACDGLRSMSIEGNCKGVLLHRSASEVETQEIISRYPLTIPFSSMNTWRKIVAGWLARTKGVEFDTLSESARKRHLVNGIRHSVIGYSQWWKLVENEQTSMLHDEAYDKVMRLIIKTFPYLADEARRQLNEATDVIPHSRRDGSCKDR